VCMYVRVSALAQSSAASTYLRRDEMRRNGILCGQEGRKKGRKKDDC
jgi:hypothetical protein